MYTNKFYIAIDCFFHKFNRRGYSDMAAAGMVVILNGPPHSGKREIIKSFQEISAQPVFTLGMQALYKIMEPGDSEKPLGVNKEADAIYMRGLHAAVSGAARGGCNMIVDHTVLEKDWYDEFNAFLEGLDVIWVQVKCNSRILEQRESEQGIRPEGSSKTLQGQMYADIPYDITIDSGVDSYEACASKLYEYIISRHFHGGPGVVWAPLAFPHPDIKAGKVIMLAGTTSAGKSTLCRHIQKYIEGPCIQFGADNAVSMIAAKYLGVPLTKEALHDYKPEKEQNLGYFLIPPGPNEDNPTEYTILQIGPVARLVTTAAFYGLKFISLAGINAVSDQIFVFKDWYEEAKEIFNDVPVLWVSINADKETLQEHDKARGDRVPGHSIGLYMQMYKDIPFDLEIDSGKLTPDEEALLVLDKLYLL